MLEELEQVRAFHSDVPGPDEATIEAARIELLEAIRREQPTPAPARVKPGRAAPRRTPLGGAALRRAQRRRRFALAGALAAAVLVVAGVLGLHGTTTPAPALAAEMNRLAKVAASQDWTGIPGPGQYLYTESDSQYDATADSPSCVISYRDHRQSWIATDGSGALQSSAGDFQFTSAADQAQCAAAEGITDPSSVLGHGGGSRFPAGGLSFPVNDWKALSTDPATLLKQVHEKDGGPNTPAELFTNVADFLRESDVPPVIRAAFYQATALIPGVRSLGTQATRDGQAGLGVAFYADGQPTHELVFDQQTGRMLGELYYDENGKLTSWADYLDQKIVNTLPDYPMESNVG